MRPNLMSPRRTTTSGEDSILAMLEREPARKRGGGAATGTRLAWYGASAGLALALTGALVWLAANNDGLRPDVQETVLADAGKAAYSQPAPASQAAPPPVPDPAVRHLALAPSAVAPAPQPAGAAVIVDQAPAGEAVPPLRLLKPAPEKAAQEKPEPAPALRVPVPAPARASAPASAPPPAARARTVAKAAPPSRPAPGPVPAARPAAGATVAAAAPASAKPKSPMAAKSTLRPVPQKAQRTVNPARNTDGTVDSDVALISAVIVHANGHAPEGSQMTELLCPNDSCKERPARE